MPRPIAPAQSSSLPRQYERAICPSCNGPFFRHDPARGLCGICTARLAGLDYKSGNEDRDDWWTQRKPWPAGMRFEDADVPREMSAGIVPSRASELTSRFGSSQLAKANFWKR